MKRLFLKSGLKGFALIEYSVSVAVTVAFIAGITVFTKRQLNHTLQGAREYAADQMSGMIEYEPYYVMERADMVSAGAKNLEIFADHFDVSEDSVNESAFTNTVCAENGQCEE